MSANFIKVQEELSNAGPTINGMAIQMADELQSLASRLQPLEPDWTGNAATYFQGLKDEWNYAAIGLFGPDGVLGRIAHAANINWGNYTDAESANCATWKH